MKEKDHGFITRAGEFLDRSQALERFGVSRSQDMAAGERQSG